MSTQRSGDDENDPVEAIGIERGDFDGAISALLGNELEDTFPAADPAATGADGDGKSRRHRWGAAS